MQEIQISAQIAQADLHMAINLAIDILKQLGIDLPMEPSVADIQAIQGEITTLLAASSLQSLLELPPMTEATLLAGLTILDSIQAACYLYNQSLFGLVIMTEVKLSLLHGNSPLSPIAYAGYGSLLMNAFQQPDLGYQFGLLSLEMSDRFGDLFVVAQTVQIVATFILPLKQSLRDYAPIRQRGIVAAIESSNIESLGWHYATDAIDLFFSSTTLTDVESKLVVYGDRLLQFNQIFQLTTVQIVHQAILNLLGWAEYPSLLIGEVLDEVAIIANCQTVDTQATLAIIGVFKVILNCILDRQDRARDAAAWMRPYISAITGNTSLFWFYCYDSLAQLGVFPSLSAQEQATALEQVVANQLVLQQLADSAPMNFQAKFDLVKGEYCRVLGQQYEAMEYYDRAICGAKSNEYIQEEGIANELAAKFYLDWGKEKVAAGYMQEAYYCYAKWGAKAKTDDLETRYPQLLQPILQQPNTSFNPLETLTSITHLSSQLESTIIYDSLDFASIIKAAQALSSTIKLDELLKQLTQIILQTSGADKCVLVLPHNKIWQVRAISTPENIKLCCEPLADNSDVPIKLIQYVKRTQSVVVIDNLQTDLPVIDDYLIERNPKSVLCLPILNQGHLAGIICLNNKFTTGVFTNDRLTVIEFLCTQAAISLENARLYQESQQALAELQIVEVALQQKEQFLRSIYDGAELVIVVIDLLEDGSFRYAGCNLAAEKASGIPSIDFVGKTLIELHGEQDGTFLNKQFTECVEGGFPITSENLLTLNGKKKWFLATHNPLKNENGRVYRIITTTIDISDRKQAEAIITQKSQELEQALGNLQQSQLQMIQTEKMSALGNLVAGVAHEINNPIGFLGGNIQPALNHINDLFGLLDLYQQQYPQPNADIQEEIETIDLDYIREDLPKLVGSMREGVKRIKDISISLRTFSRADTDYPVACNIHDGIDSTIMILKHRFKANENRPEIAVIKDYGDSPLVECYAGQLNQVFMNLLANAIDALDESNIGKKYAEITNQITIKTELSPEKKQVIIQIRDNGIGMSEQVRSKIFDKLFTTKGVGKGTGLGMAIARQIIIEKHGGAIEVNSQLGTGTEFVLTLPLTEKK